MYSIGVGQTISRSTTAITITDLIVTRAVSAISKLLVFPAGSSQ